MKSHNVPVLNRFGDIRKFMKDQSGGPEDIRSVYIYIQKKELLQNEEKIRVLKEQIARLEEKNVKIQDDIERQDRFKKVNMRLNLEMRLEEQRSRPLTQVEREAQRAAELAESIEANRERADELRERNSSTFLQQQKDLVNQFLEEDEE